MAQWDAEEWQLWGRRSKWYRLRHEHRNSDGGGIDNQNEGGGMAADGAIAAEAAPTNIKPEESQRPGPPGARSQSRERSRSPRDMLAEPQDEAAKVEGGAAGGAGCGGCGSGGGRDDGAGTVMNAMADEADTLLESVVDSVRALEMD